MNFNNDFPKELLGQRGNKDYSQKTGAQVPEEKESEMLCGSVSRWNQAERSSGFTPPGGKSTASHSRQTQETNTMTKMFLNYLSKNWGKRKQIPKEGQRVRQILDKHLGKNGKTDEGRRPQTANRGPTSNPQGPHPCLPSADAQPPAKLCL